jgi:hypothetical protein
VSFLFCLCNKRIRTVGRRRRRKSAIGFALCQSLEYDNLFWAPHGAVKTRSTQSTLSLGPKRKRHLYGVFFVLLVQQADSNCGSPTKTWIFLNSKFFNNLFAIKIR